VSREPRGQTVVFDIGWVLLHLTPEPVLNWLSANGVSHQGIDDIAARIDLEAHESGRLDGLGLLANLTRLAGSSQTDAAHRLWLDMFAYQEDMFALARRLRHRYRVFLLSNVGDLHWAHLNAHYGVAELADAVLPSFQAGIMKPHAGIYEQAEQRFDLDPTLTVFIDDRADNIEAVRRRGWRGIVHRSTTVTITELQRLGYLTD
jgi:FMN phosphatase YigB (HAD superfamily)